MVFVKRHFEYIETESSQVIEMIQDPGFPFLVNSNSFDGWFASLYMSSGKRITSR